MSWQIQGMPDTVSVVIRQGPPGGEICGEEIVAMESQNGCYDLPYLSDRVWWSFCNTGRDCPGYFPNPVTGREVGPSKRSYPPTLPKRASVTEMQRDATDLDVVHTDEEGDLPLDLSLGTTGRGGTVINRNVKSDSEELAGAPNVERQSTTFTPPDDCFLDAATCQSLADSGLLKARCVNCVQDFGPGVQASGSSQIDCRNSGSACIVTYTDTVTVTDTIEFGIKFGATIGDTGTIGGNGDASFNFGESISIATAHATAQGLSIPQGKMGYVQFQPQAFLGTVVTTTADGNVCDSAGLNKICGAAPGIIVSSNDDGVGRYSIVPLS